MSRVISFASGKGGVGKTSLVANLGKLWANKGRRTLLVDGDWALGKLSITLGVRPQWTVEKVLDGTIEMEKAIQQVTANLFLLASPSGLLGFEELGEAERNQIFFEMEAVSQNYDLVLFDHSSGLNWGVLQFAAASHQHVIVTTPEPTSYTDAYAIMKILKLRFAIREFWLLVTMSQNAAETERSMARFLDVARSNLGVRIHLLDIFPWAAELSQSIRRQQLFVNAYPEHPITGQLGRIAEALETSQYRQSHGLSFGYMGETHLQTR